MENTGDSVRDRDVGQADALTECPLTYAGNIAADGHFGQIGTVRKCTVIYNFCSIVNVTGSNLLRNSLY